MWHMSAAEIKKETKAGFEIEVLDAKDPSWPEKIDELREELGAPNEPSLFPAHFLKATFPKIGGEVVILKHGREEKDVLFLFPRRKGSNRFTARLHIAKDGGNVLDKGYIYQTLAWAGVDFELYDPKSGHLFKETHESLGAFDIGRPSKEEGQEIRVLQKKIWGAPDDFLYPVDIHSEDFDMATSLVVREDEEVIGFLFGFYKYDDAPLPSIFGSRIRSDLKVESQLMGFLPEYRGKGLGFELKRWQGMKARGEGVDIVNWTVDPLQFPNAVLNFGKLRSIAYDFYPDYYQFRNELNQVSASRFGITWIMTSPRVEAILHQENRGISIVLNPEELKDISYVNSGPVGVDLSADGTEWLAIEIPGDWSGLQKRDIAAAVEKQK